MCGHFMLIGGHFLLSLSWPKRLAVVFKSKLTNCTGVRGEFRSPSDRNPDTHRKPTGNLTLMRETRGETLPKNFGLEGHR